MDNEETIDQPISPSRQRAFCRLSRHHNSVSPSPTEEDGASNIARSEYDNIAHVRTSVNGDSVTLQYPIVTRSSDKHYYEPWTMTLKRKTKKFLGIEEDGDEDRETLWRVRRIRMANR